MKTREEIESFYEYVCNEVAQTDEDNENYSMVMNFKAALEFVLDDGRDSGRYVMACISKLRDNGRHSNPKMQAWLDTQGNTSSLGGE